MSGASFTTNVPQPYYGPNGLVVPTEAAILAGVQADINTALGGNVNPGLTTPQGQIASSETAVIGDSNASLLWFVNGVDPAYSSGRLQDAIGRLYFISRLPGMPTIQPVICSGLNKVTIYIGAMAQDQSGNIWLAQQVGTISNGSVTINFFSAAVGPIPAPSSLTVYQGPFGWESAAPTGDAVIGNDVESAAAYEQRRKNSVAGNSVSLLDSILGTVLAVPGVLDCYVTENTSSVSLTIGGVVLGPKSLYVCPLGGTSTAIAFAIWSKKAPGCGYNGSTIVTVTDPNPAYAPPVPSYMVAYQTPEIVAFAVLVTLVNNSGIPSNAQAQIANGSNLNGTGNGIIAGFNGLDGGTRAKIGSTILASRYYVDVTSLGTWAQVISLQIGILGSGCTFTGSIAGTILTVSVISLGALASGQLIQDTGLLASGTLIVNQISGPPGGVGTYTVSVSQTVTSESMSATNLVNEVTMNINQAPAVSAINIGLVLVTI